MPILTTRNRATADRRVETSSRLRGRTPRRGRPLSPARVAATAFGAALALFATTANAQVNYGNLKNLYRLQINVAGAPQTPFGFDDLNNVETSLEDAALRARYATYTGTQALVANFDFRGLDVVGRYATGVNDFILEVPGADTSLCENAALGLPAGSPCTFRYAGGTRAQNYFDFEDDIDNLDNDLLTKLLFRNLARRSPIDPLAGNPNSIQGSLVRQGLDLASADSALDNAGAETGEPWLVGLSYSRVAGGRFDGDYWNARVQRSFRLVEGSRGQLKLSIPLSVTIYNGALSAQGTIGAGYEFEISPGKWSLEPRIGYGLVASPDLLSAGQMVSASLTSRYRIDGIGRGYFLVGNMVGYTTTLPTAGLLGADIDPGLKNTILRNGLAYEMPLKLQMGGRAQSLRASYTFTSLQGDDLFLEQFHEVAVSFGVRSRGGDVRNTFELFRAGLTGTFGSNYHSITAMIGARF
jgi:hypothetical protein